MDMKRFEKMLAVSGTDLGAWPEGAARDARLLMARSGEARQLHQAMQFVDQALAETRYKVEPQDVTRVISGALAAIRELPPPMSLMDHLRSIFAVPLPRLAFGVTAAAMGFVIGIVIGAPGNTQAAQQETGVPIITASANDALF